MAKVVNALWGYTMIGLGVGILSNDYVWSIIIFVALSLITALCAASTLEVY